MGKKLPHTPSSRIRSTVRQLWLRSRERGTAWKRAKGHCECCGAKGSHLKGGEVKLHVHHRDGIEWEKVIEYIRSKVLQSPERFDVLCEDCHAEEHSSQQR